MTTTSRAPVARQVQLAVLGSPIAHSRSPQLHAAAYARLGLDWNYEAIDVTGASLAGFIGSLDQTWRGLSLTMPLKRDVIPLLGSADALVASTGSANTVLFGGGGDSRGYNTDVFGIAEAFRRHGHARLTSVHVLGGGATAASAIAASAALGASSVVVSVRSPDRASGLRAVAEAFALDLRIGVLDEAAADGRTAAAVISTLPNGAEAQVKLDQTVRESAPLLDVAYHPWPTALAAGWQTDVIPGIEMLVLQALAQVRIFVGADPEKPLPGEASVLADMFAAASH